LSRQHLHEFVPLDQGHVAKPMPAPEYLTCLEKGRFAVK
jgi:hypothetical protein